MSTPRSTTDATPLSNLGSASELDSQAGQLLSHHSPLFWFGVLAATTFGLAGLSTSSSIRLGPLRAGGSVSAGKD